MGSVMWERGVPIVAAAGCDLTPRSVAAPSTRQVMSPAGPALVAVPRSS